MESLNLTQIAERLNEEFSGDSRKIVFWYDSDADFAEDIQSLKLENAKVLYLQKDNQFKTKYILECEDKESNYLVYAPFAKPQTRENHLADTIRYSKEFFADRSSIICSNLNIDDSCKPLVKKHLKFFANKERTEKLKDFEIDKYDEKTLIVALLSVLCGNKTSSIEEVLRCLITESTLDDNKYLTEFEKYDLTDAFWEQIKDTFGYDYTFIQSEKPNLKHLLTMMFITYASKYIQNVPKSWNSFISYKSGSIIVFIDNLMNSFLYSEKYDELSKMMYGIGEISSAFEKTDIDSLITCGLFADIDKKIISWIISRIDAGDLGAKADEKDIPTICALRRKMHFGKAFSHDYYVVENAYRIMAYGEYNPITGVDNIAKFYIDFNYIMDMRYRYFYYHYDKLEVKDRYENLRDTVERAYTNSFLNKITANWNETIVDGPTMLPHQIDFFEKYIKTAKEKTVVIISDAFRYEVAHTLNEKLKMDEKCTSSINAMEGVLPSYTPLGMASLLPHSSIEYTENFEVLVDGQACATTEQRQNILQSYKKNSKCVQFDKLKDMKRDDMRELFNGQDVVYIYHNQVDARGDAAKTENEVFVACEEAVTEIHRMIRRISSLANTHHFYVTADHGFIYKRDKIESSEKIGGIMSKSNTVGQRYCLSNSPIDSEGVCNKPLSEVLKNNDRRFVSYPLASDIFKVSGAGQNYVHGGSSPQEMIVPLVEVKVEQGKTEVDSAKVELVSLTSKITNLITSLDFVQTAPVSDTVKKATYRFYFLSDSGEKISNENICIADKKDSDTAKRMFKLRFNFKNKQYSKSEKYYLTEYDDTTGIERNVREFVIDIAFANDFGFGF